MSAKGRQFLSSLLLLLWRCCHLLLLLLFLHLLLLLSLVVSQSCQGAPCYGLRDCKKRRRRVNTSSGEAQGKSEEVPGGVRRHVSGERRCSSGVKKKQSPHLTSAFCSSSWSPPLFCFSSFLSLHLLIHLLPPLTPPILSVLAHTPPLHHYPLCPRPPLTSIFLAPCLFSHLLLFGLLLICFISSLLTPLWPPISLLSALHPVPLYHPAPLLILLGF